MNILNFLDIFNSIKPTLQEISVTDTSLSSDVLSDIYSEYDLHITSMEICDDLLIDLLLNTNLCELSFSAFHFKKPTLRNNSFEIGSLEEKGHIFFNAADKNVFFIDSGNTISPKKRNALNQLDFIKFLLIYWEFDFNRIFRNNKSILHTKNIFVESSNIQPLSIFEVLLNEIGRKVSDL